MSKYVKKSEIQSRLFETIFEVKGNSLNYYVLRGRTLVYNEERVNGAIVTTVLKYENEEDAMYFCNRMNKKLETNVFQYFGSFDELEVRQSNQQKSHEL